MKPLYSQSEFNESRSTDLLPLKCYICNKIFYRTKHQIQRYLNPNHSSFGCYCSPKCRTTSNIKKISVKCINCNKMLVKLPSDIKKSKSGNNFCNQSCAASYNNKHKSHGTRRSKLEIWLEERLTSIYPNLDIDFNCKDTIGSELDIYIPSLNIAFELNGIFHYEPIYGVDKLEKIQENDKSKSKACHDAKIDLCTIDVSSLKYFKESTSQKYLDIITNIIKERHN